MDILDATKSGVKFVFVLVATINLAVSGFARSDVSTAAEGCINDGSVEMDIDFTVLYEKSDKIGPFTNHTRVHLPFVVPTPRGNCSSPTSQQRIVAANTTVDVFVTIELNNESNFRVLTDAALVPGIEDTTGVINKRAGAVQNARLLLQFPANKTYRCRAGQKLVLHSAKAHASLVFSQLRIQPLAQLAKAERGNIFVCQEDHDPVDSSATKAEYFIPLILAVCLSMFAILLVVGYVVHRKIRGRGYTSVE